MKAKSLWLYILLALSVVLIVLGLSYMGEKGEKTDKEGVAIAESIVEQFEQVDLDKNGSISLREFALQMNAQQKVVQAKAKKTRLKKLQAQFEFADKSKDSYIGAEEYADLVLIKQRGDNAPPLSTFDTNGDDKLGFREYIAFRDKVAAGSR